MPLIDFMWKERGRKLTLEICVNSVTKEDEDFTKESNKKEKNKLGLETSQIGNWIWEENLYTFHETRTCKRNDVFKEGIKISYGFRAKTLSPLNYHGYTYLWAIYIHFPICIYEALMV